MHHHKNYNKQRLLKKVLAHILQTVCDSLRPPGFKPEFFTSNEQKLSVEIVSSHSAAHW